MCSRLMFTLQGEAQNRVNVRSTLLQAVLTIPDLPFCTACLQTINQIPYATVPSAAFCFFISSVAGSDAEMITLLIHL